MTTHFQCLGFPLAQDDASAARLPGILRAIFDGGRPLPAPEGFHAAEWRSEEGAAAYAAVAVDPATGEMEVRCLTPAFLGGTRQRVKVFRTLPDPGCPFCDYLHGEVAVPGAGRGSPFFTEIKDPAWTRDLDLRGAGAVLQTSLLAVRIEAYRDAADFAARRGGDLEPRAFVPVGLMGTPHRPRAKVAGEVLEARRLVNPLAGMAFHHARVAAFGGEFDLLAADADLPGGLAPGQVVLAECFLVSRFPEGIPGGTAA
jgi:hypothetical protein